MQVTPLDLASQSQNFRLIAGRHVAPEKGVSAEIVIRHVPDWITDARYHRLSKNTISAKQLSLDKFIWWLKETDRSKVTPFIIRTYIAYITDAHEHGGRWGNPKLIQPLSERGVQFHFVNVRAYLRWLVMQGIVEEDCTTGVSIPKPILPEIQPFTPDHVIQLLNACKRTTDPMRDTAILSLLIDTGLRASELCSLNLNRLTLNTTYGTITVVGKGNKKRTVPFATDTSRALWLYLRENPMEPHEPVFTGNRGPRGSRQPLTRSGLLQLFERLRDMTGMTGVRCSPHTCRHTFAIEFLRRGGNLLALQLMLGHENLEMVKTYAKLAAADVLNQHRDHSPLSGILRPR